MHPTHSPVRKIAGQKLPRKWCTKRLGTKCCRGLWKREAYFLGSQLPKGGESGGHDGKRSISVGPRCEMLAYQCLSLCPHLELQVLFGSVMAPESFCTFTLLPSHCTPSPHSHHLPGAAPPVIIPGLHPQRNKPILFPMLPLGVRTRTLSDI